MRATDSLRTERLRGIPLAIAAVAALSAGMLLLAPDPAHAEAGDLLVSTDGTHFGTTAAGPLFTDGIVFMPGASRTASLAVRNPTSRDALYSIRLAGVEASDAGFADTLTLSAQGGRTVSLGSGDTCPALVLDAALPAGATATTLLDLAMADVPGTVGQGERADFALRVSLREAGTPAPASPCHDGQLVPAVSAAAPAATVPVTTARSATDVLADTGARILLPALLGVILAGIGALILLPSRRVTKAQR